MKYLILYVIYLGVFIITGAQLDAYQLVLIALALAPVVIVVEVDAFLDRRRRAALNDATPMGELVGR
jgi:hypothetical protein